MERSLHGLESRQLALDVARLLAMMAQLLVRNLEDKTKARLQRRAQRHGRSTEDEVREILRNVVRDEGVQGKPLGSRGGRALPASGLRTICPSCAAGSDSPMLPEIVQ